MELELLPQSGVSLNASFINFLGAPLVILEIIKYRGGDAGDMTTRLGLRNSHLLVSQALVGDFSQPFLNMLYEFVHQSSELDTITLIV